MNRSKKIIIWIIWIGIALPNLAHLYHHLNEVCTYPLVLDSGHD